MAFGTSLSGLNNASTSLDVIGNNLANSGTVGFKSAQAQFSDVYAAAVAGSSVQRAAGLGAKTSTIAQSFGQGNITSSTNPFDVAINGRGFFRLSGDGAVTYTRNGQFHLEGELPSDGTAYTDQQLADQKFYLLNADGYRVTGYNADYSTDPAGTIATSSPADLLIDPLMSGSATTAVDLVVNLDAGATPPAGPFNPNDALTYNSANSVTVYDENGDGYAMALYYVKQAPANGNSWQMHTMVDGVLAGPFALNFAATGALTSAMPLTLPAVTLAGGGTLPAIQLDMTGSTQFASLFSENFKTQDGYADGRMSNVSVGKDGILLANYSNGQSRKVGQFALADFVNPNGLTSLGNNQWAESFESGTPQLGTPASSAANAPALGVLQGGAVEDSNTDLSAELIALIVQQRNYQANAQAIKAQDQILQTLAGIR